MPWLVAILPARMEALQLGAAELIKPGTSADPGIGSPKKQLQLLTSHPSSTTRSTMPACGNCRRTRILLRPHSHPSVDLHFSAAKTVTLVRASKTAGQTRTLLLPTHPDHAWRKIHARKRAEAIFHAQDASLSRIKSLTDRTIGC